MFSADGDGTRGVGDCTCICTEGETNGGFKLEATTLVDVSLDGLSLFEAAHFLEALAPESIVVPMARRNERHLSNSS